jgi:hypothetical protein
MVTACTQACSPFDDFPGYIEPLGKYPQFHKFPIGFEEFGILHKFPIGFEEFGILHKVPATEFSVLGELKDDSMVLFRIFGEDALELGSVTLRPVLYHNSKCKGIGGVDYGDGDGYEQSKPRFWPNGIFINVFNSKPPDSEDKNVTEAMRKKVAKVLLQIVMEFAQKFNVGNRIYGCFSGCELATVSKLGMVSNSDTDAKIAEKAHEEDFRDYNSGFLYMAEKGAEKFRQCIADHPIYLKT